jgi:hypothetical protein
MQAKACTDAGNIRSDLADSIITFTHAINAN